MLLPQADWCGGRCVSQAQADALRPQVEDYSSSIACGTPTIQCGEVGTSLNSIAPACQPTLSSCMLLEMDPSPDFRLAVTHLWTVHLHLQTRSSGGIHQNTPDLGGDISGNGGGGGKCKVQRCQDEAVRLAEVQKWRHALGGSLLSSKVLEQSELLRMHSGSDAPEPELVILEARKHSACA